MFGAVNGLAGGAASAVIGGVATAKLAPLLESGGCVHWVKDAVKTIAASVRSEFFIARISEQSCLTSDTRHTTDSARR